jgi:hypothetical protein
MFTNRAVGEWNRPVAKWSVTMKFKVAGGTSVAWRISRVRNSKMDKLTHIYPGEKNRCFDAAPEYSLLLGDYLERITGFTGETFE